MRSTLDARQPPEQGLSLETWDTSLLCARQVLSLPLVGREVCVAARVRIATVCQGAEDDPYLVELLGTAKARRVGHRRTLRGFIRSGPAAELRRAAAPSLRKLNGRCQASCFFFDLAMVTF